MSSNTTNIKVLKEYMADTVIGKNLNSESYSFTDDMINKLSNKSVLLYTSSSKNED